MGITQHHNSVETIQEMVNTHLLVATLVGKARDYVPSEAINVQGDRTVGINHIANPSLFKIYKIVLVYKRPVGMVLTL